MAEVFMRGQQAITVPGIPIPLTSEIFAAAVGAYVSSLNPNVDYGSDIRPRFPSSEVILKGIGQDDFDHASIDVEFGATRPSSFPCTEVALGGRNEPVGASNINAARVNGDNTGKNVSYAENAQPPTGNSTEVVTGVRGVASRIIGTGNSNEAPVGADNQGKNVTYAPSPAGAGGNGVEVVTFSPPVNYNP